MIWNVFSIPLGDLHVSRVDPDKWRRVQLSADPPVETGPFEGVGRLAFFLLCIGFGSDVLLPDPFVLSVLPLAEDSDATEEVPVDQLVFSLPFFRAYRFIQDVLIHPRVFVEQDATALLRDRLHATVDLVCSQFSKFEHLITSLLPLPVGNK